MNQLEDDGLQIALSLIRMRAEGIKLGRAQRAEEVPRPDPEDFNVRDFFPSPTSVSGTKFQTGYMISAGVPSNLLHEEGRGVLEQVGLQSPSSDVRLTVIVDDITMINGTYTELNSYTGLAPNLAAFQEPTADKYIIKAGPFSFDSYVKVTLRSTAGVTLDAVYASITR